MTTDATAPAIPITPAQRRTLHVLNHWTMGGPRAGKVASMLGHDSATNAARTLDNLVLKGLAETYDDASGRRRWRLSDAGRAVADPIV
ncbi:MarR family winged helix-turn-helix transcriptional regulator [Cellulosimicrobium sp. Marseille-Q4280]|uniref:MarR family winged helix-turn-helix transcriptional regulator n=1 Tax=Cellulosimicrobium sp. Marseille-Q4280 TaxID=2937992 RepID=UPI00203F5845|nr:MarR family winged helix-turn-helix transcriptional regulator [Cellulosimicrobium sp. Marseille-Q4280]